MGGLGKIMNMLPGMNSAQMKDVDLEEAEKRISSDGGNHSVYDD